MQPEMAIEGDAWGGLVGAIRSVDSRDDQAIHGQDITLVLDKEDAGIPQVVIDEQHKIELVGEGLDAEWATDVEVNELHDMVECDIN
jgi:hypothetical protein